ncbi:EpsI family protein [Singulisphaera sp. PoT]|uniref:EpsI family protein n=1 Tax=Singulisphaera sp. PoT TaxID=3411797 RepID=UPI003BF488E9
MSPLTRVVICGALLTCGYAAQAALESYVKIERPPLNGSLATLPMQLGDWVGRDEPVKQDIIDRAQTTDFINRIYEWRKQPGRSFGLWINYSTEGLNLRHSPEVCLPSSGWAKVESLCKEKDVEYQPGKKRRIMRLAYTKEDQVEGIGFWYYIFGEGSLERYVRKLPITSRSSHGRTTRGSGMTVEVFCPGDLDPNGEALDDFAKELLVALEPFLPKDRADYYVP